MLLIAVAMQLDGEFRLGPKPLTRRTHPVLFNVVAVVLPAGMLALPVLMLFGVIGR